MSYEIQKNVQLPPVQRSGGRSSKYPFGEMTVGDSFFVDNVDPKLVQQAAAAYGRRHNVKFETRRCDGGIRVWKK